MMFTALLTLSFSFFLYRRIKRYLRFLQQDDYSASRFVKWFFENRSFDKRGTALALAGGAVSLAGWDPRPLMIAGFLLLAIFEGDPQRSGKMTLKMTERAKRLLWSAFLLASFSFLSTSLLLYSLMPSWLTILLFCQAAPLYLLFSLGLLSIDESRRQRRFLNEAKKRLLEVNPLVIGITGSYGKTSTKHFLSRLMQLSLGPTFYPGKGVNTPMGITREIRERLKDRTPYAVVEMAAYGPGSIRRLTRLTPPRGAILTTIGKAHLERFGSQEVIAKTKGELAEAVPEDGFLVLNGDDPFLRRMGKQHQNKTTLYYGYSDERGPLDLKIVIGKAGVKGTEISFIYKGKSYEATVALHGKPIIANLASAFLTACHLGADPSFVAATLPHMEAFENRLQVRAEGDTIFVHDAYNSNPVGFAAALEVLGSVDGQRRILMTPGMIELGQDQEYENEQAALLASRVADIVLIVGWANRKALETGLLRGGFSPEQMHFFETRDEALAYLKKIQKKGDVVLIENDLLDLHETKEAF